MSPGEKYSSGKGMIFSVFKPLAGDIANPSTLAVGNLGCYSPVSTFDPGFFSSANTRPSRQLLWQRDHLCLRNAASFLLSTTSSPEMSLSPVLPGVLGSIMWKKGHTQHIFGHWGAKSKQPCLSLQVPLREMCLMVSAIAKHLESQGRKMQKK